MNERGRGKYYDIGYRLRNVCRIIVRSFGGWVRAPLARLSTPEACVPNQRSRFCKKMKAKVYVTLKPSVLDPQGKAIKHSVELLGYNGIDDIRQGKYFEIALDSGLNEDNARSEATRMAREILSNPIIEDFRVEIEK
jgi:phosphoribosylformylglycinamidine synthase PurS subunit